MMISNSKQLISLIKETGIKIRLLVKVSQLSAISKQP